jgi:glyoxylase-like metal-dependent hydrolase (beta-lactamase superfamily II)
LNHRVTLQPLSDRVVNAEHEADGDVGVRCTVLLGDRYTIVFDTLYSRTDMREVVALVEKRRRPVIVVNSHADDDHAWGNAAFPLAPIIGHRFCRERFLAGDELSSQLRLRRQENPEEFGDVELVPPDLTFDTALSLDAGGFTVELRHLPGHKRDCLVAHLPELGILLGGDTVETPIPLLVDGPLQAWSGSLRAWANRKDVKTVVASHGPIAGPELLLRNADYLDSLAAGRSDGWAPDPGTPDFYTDAHRRNVARAAELTA